MSLKTRSCLSHLIKRESLMFSLGQYCLDFPIFTMIESKFHFSPTFSSNPFFWTRNTKNIYIYVLFAGWEVRMVKNISRPRSQFFTIRTDPKPVNNMFIFLNLTKFFPIEPEWLRAVNTARSFINWKIFERVNGS